jgi:hypothetical protein
MATGETFRGVDQIRNLAEKAMAGRIHTKALHMELTNMFSGGGADLPRVPPSGHHA